MFPRFKTCSICGSTYRRSEFAQDLNAKDEKSTYCLYCKRESYQKYKRKHRKSRLELVGITINDYHRIYASQGGKCSICDTRYDVLAIDHCHKTNKFRGLICKVCNSGLGFFKDSPSIINRALDYITINYPMQHD